jgi:protein-disulfide isomerase
MMDRSTSQPHGTKARQDSKPATQNRSGSWSRQIALSVALVVIAVGVVLVVAARSSSEGGGTGGPETASDERLVRPDSQRLSYPDAPVASFVEFLDPECEACRAAAPTVEQLVETYGDRVTFVVRYFPLHTNSKDAARAAEAAAAQGRFEEMLARLFETQPEWGENRTSQRDYFFAIAGGLGLDMDQFEQTFDDPATTAKIERDLVDARSLGLTGTPTFFLDGEQLQPRSADELVRMVEDAVSSS